MWMNISTWGKMMAKGNASSRARMNNNGNTPKRIYKYTTLKCD
jgi:hypothetical protein